MKFTARGDASLLTCGGSPQNNAQQPAAAPAASLRGLLGRGLPAFASLGAALMGGPAAAPPPPAEVVERRTKTIFPGDFCLTNGQHGCPIITGAGARTKRVAGIKNLDIYALALYVDQGAARSALQGRFRGASAASLAADQELFDELMRHDGIEKTLRVVITSGLVNRRNFLDALEQRLAPPLEQSGDLAALDSFIEQFDRAAFRKGLEISFTATLGGKLVTKFDGQEVGTIASRPLTHNLLQLYLGPDPVSKGAKESFGVGLAGMVLA